MTSPPVPANLAQAAIRINAELTRSAPMTLSLNARTRLEIVHAEFLGDVGQEAIRIARRSGLSTVDEAHVDMAYERISSGSTGSGWATAANTVGGLLSGAGIASIYSITFTPGPHGTAEIVAALLLSAVGFALVVFGLTLALARRR